MELITRQLSAEAHKEAEKALASIVAQHEVKVKEDLERFAKEFNERYHNHVIKFCDGMGQRSIELYHRLRQEPEQRIMWFTEGEMFNEYDGSDYSFLADHKPYQEMIEILETASVELSSMYTISASDWICTHIE